MGNFIEGLDKRDLPVGTKYGIRDNTGIPQMLPDLIGNKRWVQFDHNEYGRMYVVEEVKVETQPNWKLMYEETKQELKETLTYANELAKDKDVEIKEAGINPEYVETENLHKERMRLENEQLSLNNQELSNRIHFGKEYPIGVWEILKTKTDILASQIANRTAAIWVALVTFGVNEVIQWLTR